MMNADIPINNNAVSSGKKALRGRPRKFNAPSRPVTITLPVHVLQQLDALGPDRAQTIVRLVESMDECRRLNPVQIVEVSSGQSVIMVNSCRYLNRIPFLHLAEIAPSRFLLIIPAGMPFTSLELAILDILEGIKEKEKSERKLLEELLEVLKRIRRDNLCVTAEMIFIRSS